MKFSHFCGSLVIQAKGSFLNGSGSVKEGKEDISVPKTFQKEGALYPYISAQCWRRWWKKTFEEDLEAYFIANTQEQTYHDLAFINPVDDLFGYFEANSEKINIEDINQVNVSQIRSSPIQITQLQPIQKFGVGAYSAIIKDKAFVHLKDGTPLPYSSRFYNADLQGVFVLDVNRIATYHNFNDRQELALKTIENYSKKKLLIEKGTDEFELPTILEIRKSRFLAAINSLLLIGGGAKSPQYGTDITPRVLLSAGQIGANPILSDIFEINLGRVRINLDRLISRVTRFSKLFVTPIYCGIRKNYIENEDEIKDRKDDFYSKTGVQLEVCSPGEIIKYLAEVDL